MSFGSYRDRTHGDVFSYFNLEVPDENGVLHPVPGYSNLCSLIAGGLIGYRREVRLQLLRLRVLERQMREQPAEPTKPRHFLDEDDAPKVSQMERLRIFIEEMEGHAAEVERDIAAYPAVTHYPICFHPKSEEEHGSFTFEHEATHGALYHALNPFSMTVKARDTFIHRALKRFVPALGPAGQQLWDYWGNAFQPGTGATEEVLTGIMGMAFVIRLKLLGRDEQWVEKTTKGVITAFASYVRKHTDDVYVDFQQLGRWMWAASRELVNKYPSNDEALGDFLRLLAAEVRT